MLIKFIYHLLGLDASWFMYELIWVFIVMAFMCYAFYVIDGDKRGIKGFIVMMLLLYAIIDLMAFAGWTFYTEEHMLEFTLFQMAFIVVAARTRFAKRGMAVFAGVFIFMSWLVTA